MLFLSKSCHTKYNTLAKHNSQRENPISANQNGNNKCSQPALSSGNVSELFSILLLDENFHDT